MSLKYSGSLILFYCVVSLLSSCGVIQHSGKRQYLVDKNATVETVALFHNLKRVMGKGVLFGHQDDTKNGFGWRNGYGQPRVSNLKSDLNEIAGSYPAVFGWDFSDIAGFYTGEAVAYERHILRRLTIDAYNRGAANTYSWHYKNPVAKEGVFWKDTPVPAVSRILSGGDHNEVYKRSLKEIADFTKSLIGEDGKQIPIIFRPFHEMDGDWFWWGKGHCTIEEYKQLYRFTVSYLRDSLSVHQFLFAWSPDLHFTNVDEYLNYYPGDEYVDLLGMDNYWDLSPDGNLEIGMKKLKIVGDIAARKHKLAALTETGLQNLTQPNWYTRNLLPVIKSAGIAYVLIWSNSKDAYWTPHKESAAVADFLSFRKDPYVIFLEKFSNMYKVK